jgi:hypothetical protein
MVKFPALVQTERILMYFLSVRTVVVWHWQADSSGEGHCCHCLSVCETTIITAWLLLGLLF